MQEFFSVTFTHKYEGACDYDPRTAVFTSLEKAEGFLDRVMSMHDARDQDYLIATIDSGILDSEDYFEVFDAEMTEEEELMRKWKEEEDGDVVSETTVKTMEG